MIIKRILTNNAVVIDDVNQQEKIVCGKGIAFKKRPGMEIDEASINQTFILDGGGEYSRFEQLLKDVPGIFRIIKWNNKYGKIGICQKF